MRRTPPTGKGVSLLPYWYYFPRAPHFEYSPETTHTIKVSQKSASIEMFTPYPRTQATMHGQEIATTKEHRAGLPKQARAQSNNEAALYWALKAGTCTKQQRRSSVLGSQSRQMHKATTKQHCIQQICLAVPNFIMLENKIYRTIFGRLNCAPASRNS